MTAVKCAHCGATMVGLVCAYCGGVSGDVKDIEAQEKALEHYHALLRSGDKRMRIKILNAGFVPDHGPLLIDAGLTCVSFINENEVSGALSDAAVQRLEAIVLKLRLLPRSSENSAAVQMFQEKIGQYRTSSKQYTVYGLIAIGVVILLVALAFWYFRS